MPTKPTGRPRGRPKGAKNIPKIEDFVAESISGSVPIPPIAPKKAARGPCAHMSPEERTEYFRALVAKRKTYSGGRKAGVPLALTQAQFEARKAEQAPLIDRIIKKMAAKGELPDDPDVVEAFKETMTVLRTQQDWKAKIAAARLVMDFKKAKPTTKVEHTVKTAEDYLDELAEDD